MLTWHRGANDPDDVTEDEIAAALAKLARQRMVGRTAILNSMDR